MLFAWKFPYFLVPLERRDSGGRLQLLIPLNAIGPELDSRQLPRRSILGAALEQLQRVRVDHVLGLGVERAVEREHVEVRVHVLGRLVVGQVELLLDCSKNHRRVSVLFRKYNSGS